MNHWRILCGDVRERLAELKAGSVRCCVTSPPYWGLRDYGVSGQLGLEVTPEAYVASIVGVFAAVRRALADDGTVWLNLGDSWNSAGGNTAGHGPNALCGNTKAKLTPRTGGPRSKQSNLKVKDLVGIPWMVAFALRADGWYLRSDIIWSKPNPMPESVQGTHYSRHRVTIDEYERLSGLRYTCECAGDAWAGNMPPLSEGEVSHRKAPLSAECEGYRRCSCEGSSRGRAGTTTASEPIAVRTPEQSQVRSDDQGKIDAGQGGGEVSRQSTGQDGERAASSTNKRQPCTQESAPEGQQHLPQEPERESAVTKTERPTPWCHSIDGGAIDSGRVGADRHGASEAVPLLQAEDEVDAGSCDSTEQGRAAHQDERRAGVRSVQFQQTGSDTEPVLVGCPGCPKCIQHHGYTFRLSAGRPTKAHEYIFLLSKSKSYYYDAAAIHEPYAPSTLVQFDQPYEGQATKDYAAVGVQNPSAIKKRITDKQRGHGRRHAGFNDRWDGMERTEQLQGGANKRSVWNVATAPYPDAHFATFPEKLIKPCILAGSAFGDTVLDPFTGSGTTGAVAIRHQRNFVGCELNPAYVELARKRINAVAPMFAEEVA